ncbi:MAG: hypothetical protein LBE56_12230 [Tannerella sp.]|jgi:hypothetical protein|nr:hypothetical protein [Tannerella sp.]
MKKSDKPTEWILIKAYTESEWDSCDFAIIHLTDKWLKLQGKRSDITRLTKAEGFVKLVYRDTNVDFYRIDEDSDFDIDDFLGTEEWAYIEMENNEPESFTKPEQKLVLFEIYFYSDGFARYIAIGENTLEEFYTEYFYLDNLKK